jgi:hypothetical protein
MSCSALFTQAFSNTQHLCNTDEQEGYTIAFGKERSKASRLHGQVI